MRLTRGILGFVFWTAAIVAVGVEWGRWNDRDAPLPAPAGRQPQAAVHAEPVGETDAGFACPEVLDSLSTGRKCTAPCCLEWDRRNVERAP